MGLVFDSTVGETTWHLVQRARSRRTCFRRESDYLQYCHWLTRYSRRYEVVIHAWVLMPDHVHVLASSRDGWACPEMMQAVAAQYQAYCQQQFGARQPLWDEEVSAHPVQADSSILNCYRYIEQHPARAALVDQCLDYRWSSHSANVLGTRDSLCRPHAAYLSLGADRVTRRRAYQQLFNTPLSRAPLADIRRCLNDSACLTGSADSDPAVMPAAELSPSGELHGH